VTIRRVALLIAAALLAGALGGVGATLLLDGDDEARRSVVSATEAAPLDAPPDWLTDVAFAEAKRMGVEAPSFGYSCSGDTCHITLSGREFACRLCDPPARAAVVELTVDRRSRDVVAREATR
jgi:hypothetical protein